VAEHLLVWLGLATFVGVTYAVVVLGGGSLVGRSGATGPALPVLATAVVALAFAPVQSRLEDLARRWLRGGAPTPYEVLSRFSSAVDGAGAPHELPAQMARLLAEGTGARWTQVWLVVQDRLTLAATWPPGASAEAAPPDPRSGARDATGPGRRAVLARHGGQGFGVLRLQEHARRPLSVGEERLFVGLAAQAGLVLRLAALEQELASRHRQLVLRDEELRASRDRLIAAQDEARRRLERDIHDGAQQHLVALTVHLRLAQTVAARAPDRAAQLLAQQSQAAVEAMSTLSQLSRGIYPTVLAGQGLLAALRAAVATSPVPVDLSRVEARRLPEHVEAALYFVTLEAVQNAAKHSGASVITVALTATDDEWQVQVGDDGAGFDPVRALDVAGGAGLVNMADRLDAAGGRLSVVSAPGRGALLTATVPAGAGPPVAVPVPQPRAGG
jgi:signal transduction histidine kinase